MSNTTVGSIYKKIIDAVVDVSRTDFEENGVSNDVLQALQEKWQNRLSETQRASFPWDPLPQAQPAHNQVSTSSVKVEPIVNSNSLPSPVSQQNGNGIQIKQEPNYDQSYLNVPSTTAYTSGLGQPQYAHQRAAQLLQKKFGSQATGSIGAIQAAQMGLPGAQQRPQSSSNAPQSLTTQQQQGVGPRLPQAKQKTALVKQEANQDNLSLAQTDGASDSIGLWKQILEKRTNGTEEGPTGRLAVDGLIRRQVQEMAQRMEAGGLLVPLDERRKSKKRAKDAPQTQNVSQLTYSHTPIVARFDGGDEDSPINDDDAINSDLDDSEDDELEGNIEADFQGDVILCLYDKVQRVKNKWKCTLKDGVVTVEGKDYVFHKAQGEFEW